MAMVDVDGSSHFSDSQPKSVGLVCELATSRRSVCSHQMSRLMTAVHKHSRCGGADASLLSCLGLSDISGIARDEVVPLRSKRETVARVKKKQYRLHY